MGRISTQGPIVAPDGRIWFVGQAGNYVARFDPKSAKFEQFAIDAGSHPHTVIVDFAGDGWYAGNRNGMIGKVDGRTGAMTRYPMPDSAAGDPHTMVFDQAGDIWFTVRVQPNRLVGFDPKKGGFVQNTPIPNGGGTVRHMVFGTKTGVIWFGSNNNTIGRAVVGQAAKPTA